MEIKTPCKSLAKMWELTAEMKRELLIEYCLFPLGFLIETSDAVDEEYKT